MGAGLPTLQGVPRLQAVAGLSGLLCFRLGQSASVETLAPLAGLAAPEGPFIAGNESKSLVVPGLERLAGDTGWSLPLPHGSSLRLSPSSITAHLQHVQGNHHDLLARWPAFLDVRPGGQPSPQVRNQWVDLLPEQPLSHRRSEAATHGRATERRAQEARGQCSRCRGQTAGHWNGRAGGSAGTAQLLQMRWADALLTDDIVRRSEVLPRQLPRREDGWRPKRHTLRATVVQSVGSAVCCGECRVQPGRTA